MARNFLWDPIEDNVIAEFDDDGGLIVEYTTEPELYGNVISQRRDGETHCLYSDGLGSTTEVTNAAGDTIATRAYAAYGQVMDITGDVSIAFQFVGERGYYTDSHAVYVRRRWLGGFGRWHSSDPTRLAMLSGESRANVSNLNQEAPLIDQYVYVENNPIFFTDPSGLDIWEKECRAGCFALFGKGGSDSNASASTLAECWAFCLVVRKLAIQSRASSVCHYLHDLWFKRGKEGHKCSVSFRQLLIGKLWPFVCKGMDPPGG